MLQVGIHSSQNPIPGSRWPTLLSTPDAATPRLTTPTESKRSSAYTSSMNPPVISSISRRKPKMTFRSPDATTPLALRLSTHPVTTSPERGHLDANSAQSSASSSTPSSASSIQTASVARSTCSFFTPSPPLFRMPLAYPSYHPYSSGQLLLAAAARADAAARRRAAENGGTERENVSLHADDAGSNGVDHHDPDGDARRSSSRTRRPVAKLRDTIDGEEGMAQDAAGKDDEANGIKSPKRKRAGGAGGTRKKRKEASAPTEVQPRRERQRRGAAAAAAAAMAENAEAVAAVLDRDSVEAVEPEETPASADGSGTPDTPIDDDKEAEIVAPKNSGGAKNGRTKRQARPKRSRKTSDNGKAETKTPTPTRATRQSRRRGTSESGSEEAAGSASSTTPVDEMAEVKEAPEEDEVPPQPAESSMAVDDFNANIDPALLAEDASAAASATPAIAAP